MKTLRTWLFLVWIVGVGYAYLFAWWVLGSMESDGVMGT